MEAEQNAREPEQSGSKGSFFLGEMMEDYEYEGRPIVVGICAMHKKSASKPMQEILVRLQKFRFLETVIFEESVILTEPIENWPLCDCLISFFSKGFPLDKAVKYAELRKPMLVNDLHMQYILQDRCMVHRLLEEHGVDQPKYAVLDRDTGNPNSCRLVETEDQLEVNDVVFTKPFVEKPISAEDHNVYIYFPSSAGGGSQRLFRKIGSRSSVYSPVSTVRKSGSFIYEEFMPTDGTDVKVYTVGPDYAHAEARKSPALDGKVERDKDGKEVRYPVILTAKEKLLARKVCQAYKQMVCGFDLLRANGKSYVCDVNGFSFVKNSAKYYDDCTKILGYMILQQLAPFLHIPYGLAYQPEDIPVVPTTYGTMMELRCVIAVIRHGDRTPKQKMKMEVRHKRFFELFEKYGGFKSGQLKLKRPKQLQEILDIARFLLRESSACKDSAVEEKTTKLEQLKSVLEMYGYFSGINRKVQLKYQPQGCTKKSSDDDTTDDSPREPSLVLILKWGGELTSAGKIQAEELGKAFRCMYPGGQGEYGHAPGLGLLRLHSTFRHDLKIYASDEGRVQMTAAAFAKGFLALEGELTPILVQMVKSANMNGLLDNDNDSSKYQNIHNSQKTQMIVKEKLQAMLNQDHEFEEEDQEKIASTGSSSLIQAMSFLKNPFQVCEKLYQGMNELLARIRELKKDRKVADMKLYHSESFELMQRRLGKIIKDFKMKNGQFDISKIPDIYDCIKFDVQHNAKVLRFDGIHELYALAKAMADLVIPQEYGITREEKLLIGQCICTPLLRKILVDLQRNVDEESTRLDSRYSKGVSTPHRHVRTRLYFTSESHIHSLLTMLRYGGLCDNLEGDEQWARAAEYMNAVSELNYMTQIVIMMYEDPTKDASSDERFHVELHFSPGAYNNANGQQSKEEEPQGQGYRSSMTKQRVSFNMPSKVNLTVEKVPEEEELEKSVKQVATAPSALKEETQGPALSVFQAQPINADSSMEGIYDRTNCTQQPTQRTKSDTSSISTRSDMSKIDASLEPGTSDLSRTTVCTQLEDKSDDTLKEVSSVGEDDSPLSPCKYITHMKNVIEPGPTRSCPQMCRGNSDSREDIELNMEDVIGTPASPVKERAESVSSEAAADVVDEACNRSSWVASSPIHIVSRNDKGASTSSYVSEVEESLKEAMTDLRNETRTRAQSLEDTKIPELERVLAGETRSQSIGSRLDLKHDEPAKSPTQEKKRLSFGNLFATEKFRMDSYSDQESENSGRAKSIFSTKVISGSSSAPNLTEVDQSLTELSGYEGWQVRSIRPLETLHNSLTLRQMELFLKKMTENAFITSNLYSPCQQPTTPLSYTPRSGCPATIGPLGQAYYSVSSSTCSSGGPSSPTNISSSDDIMRKLQRLVDRSESMETSNTSNSAPSSQDRLSDTETSGQLDSPRL